MLYDDLVKVDKPTNAVSIGLFVVESLNETWGKLMSSCGHLSGLYDDDDCLLL